MIPATRLDTPRSRLYKARAFLGAALLLWSSAALAENVMGAVIPDGFQKVGENRFKANDDWKGTMDTLKKVYPFAAYPRRNIVNQPGIKAVHIVNPSGKNFEGLNIYEANDEVRIYVVPAGVVKAGKKKAAPEQKSSESKKK